MTAEKLKRAFLELYIINGYNATSLENIAKEVGIKKSSIYSHFKTKEEIFFVVFKEILNKDVVSIKRLSKEFIGCSVKEKLNKLFKYYCNQYLSKSYGKEITFLKRALLFPPAFLKEKLQEEFKVYEDLINTILTDIFCEGINNGEIRDCDIKELLSSFYCIIDGLFIEVHYYPRKEYITRLDCIWNIFWRGIKNNIGTGE